MSADCKQKRCAPGAGLTAIFAVVALAITITVPVQAQGNQRPLSDFIGAQGTTACFTPPAPAQLAATTGADKTNGSAQLTPPRFALVDYSGVEAKFLHDNYGVNLGTTVSGTVMERPLADGSALVTVDLQTKNALGWAMNWDPNAPASQDNTNPLLFGQRVQDLIANPALPPALGDIHFRIVFTNTAPRAPLPDLVCINAGPDCPNVVPCPGLQIDYLDAQATITGPLHSLAGLGPDGTPGQLVLTQTGLIQPGIHNGFNNKPFSDAFPVESIALKRIGK